MIKAELTMNQRVDRVADLGNAILDMVNTKVASGEYEALEAAVALSAISAIVADRTIEKEDMVKYVKLRLHNIYKEGVK